MITHSVKEIGQQKKQWAVGSGGGGWRWQGSEGEGRELGKFEKRGIGNIGGLAPFCKLCKETLKISHPPIVKPTPPFLVSPDF